MILNSWISYVTTVLILMITPGPSQLLMLSNSMQHGVRRSIFTAMGDLTANSLQMLIAGLGLASMVANHPYALTMIKGLGAAYLTWLGFQMIRKAKSRAKPPVLAGLTASLPSLWVQGFLTSAANPKAIVFFAALFPLFILPGKPFISQFIVLSVTYLVMDALFLCTYGLCAEWVSRKFQGKTRCLIEQAGGGFIILAALLLVIKAI